jgi:predicted small lipoprotein YifL
MTISPERRLLLRTALGATAAVALSACGQKGPLYFPEDRLEEEKARRRRSELPLAPRAARPGPITS